MCSLCADLFAATCCVELIKPRTLVDSIKFAAGRNVSGAFARSGLRSDSNLEEVLCGLSDHLCVCVAEHANRLCVLSYFLAKREKVKKLP